MVKRDKAESYAIYSFPVGFLKIAYEEDRIVAIDRCEPTAPGAEGRKTALTEKVAAQLMEYFQGKRKVFDFPYELKGTDFQRKVWHALEEIPYGETRSYKDIAVAVGNPKACRAVGMANNRNPVSIVVPCHRVIGSGGALVGYGGGLDMKEYLLRLEGSI